MKMKSGAGAAAIVLALAVAVPACGRSGHAPAASPAPSIPSGLLRGARPVGTGARFRLPVTGPVAGTCEPEPGPRTGTHVEVFADNRVLLLPAGIGTRPPRTVLDGRVTGARCYGAVVTVDPTGLVLVRPGTRPTLATLFRSWGQRLSATGLASFQAAVSVYVDGRPWHGRGGPGAVPLTPHAEIVLEVGPHVPPHASYAFPPGT